MKTNESYDRLVDMLLTELVGGQTPPDVRAKVIDAAERLKSPQIVPHLFRPATAGRSKTPVLAIAATLVVLGTLAAFLAARGIHQARTPQITEISGMVSPRHGPLKPGETISTGANSKAVLTFRDGTVVTLDPETTIQLARLPAWDRSKQLKLDRGRLRADVARQPKGKPLVLNTRAASAEVLGTQLSLSQHSDRSRLEVSEGAVRFLPLGGNPGGVLVEAGFFAEMGKAGLIHGKIEPPQSPGIIHFTLMNAETDAPLREQPLANGETITLSSLPTNKINIRADYVGDQPDSVQIDIRRQRGHPTGLEPRTSRVHTQPPYFVAGDHWSEGRPEDCQEWTPPAGLYQLTAVATYKDANKQALVQPLKITFRIAK